ncbi:MAG: APC family permease [Chitinophagaceae bacterium]|nr:MAG: APC family permease [Chitinophagaceae bacterium]
MKPAKLNLFDLTMIVIGLVIGMGIFRTSSDSAKEAITPAVFFIAWFAGGLIAVCGALTYAEIGSRYPVVGGYYKIFAYAYHPSVAFAINCVILISNASSLSGVALIGSEYISQVVFDVPPPNYTKAFIAMGAISLFYGVNLLGLRMSSKTQNVLMLIKIGMVILLISALFFPAIHAPVNVPLAAAPEYTWTEYIKSFGLALIAVSFTYGGYQQTINFGDEVNNPQKTMPRGIITGIVVIILLYLTVNFAYYKVIGFEELKTSKGIAAIVAERLFGATGRYVFSVLLFLAVLAYVNVLLLSNPRVMYAMSLDRILPAAFRKKDEKRDVLTVSLTVFAAICIIVLFFADTFDKILKFTIFLDCIGMAFSAATLFILRKRTRHLDNTGIYKMKLYPLLPIIFIAAYIFVAISIAIDNYQTALTGLGVLAAFIIIYFVSRRFSRTTD